MSCDYEYKTRETKTLLNKKIKEFKPVSQTTNKGAYFIQVHDYETEDEFFLNTNNILCIYPFYHGSSIYGLSSIEPWKIKESPEQILNIIQPMFNF